MHPLIIPLVLIPTLISAGLLVFKKRRSKIKKAGAPDSSFLADDKEEDYHLWI
jgi:hypothetical protein